MDKNRKKNKYREISRVQKEKNVCKTFFRETYYSQGTKACPKNYMDEIFYEKTFSWALYKI